MPPDVFLNLLIAAVFGVICALVAHSRGRSVVAWFFLGGFLTCIALVLILVLPDLKAEEQRQERLRRENRRLREQLRSDRQLADQRNAEMQQRLGVHDRALHLDTRTPDQLAAEEGAGGAGPALSHADIEFEKQRACFAGTEWYFLDQEDQQVGPLSFDEFKRQWRSGDFGAMSFVWAPILSDWQRMGEVQGLEEVLRV
ncbi:MAG: hypothetical protein CSA62_10845 [Planctomycetota bacterium]|nr:MAG: hypothetical protein CSA62_10845 [Planctomycetota bacterium]